MQVRVTMGIGLERGLQAHSEHIETFLMGLASSSNFSILLDFPEQKTLRLLIPSPSLFNPYNCPIKPLSLVPLFPSFSLFLKEELPPSTDY